MTDPTDFTAMPDWDAQAQALGDLEGLAARFGRALAGALGEGAAKGRDLESVLKAVARSLAGTGSGGSGGALGDLLAGLLGSLAGLITGGGGFRGLSPFTDGGTFAAPASLPLDAIRAAPTLAARLPGGAGPPGVEGSARVPAAPVSVNVTIATPDAESFRRSEGQVAAALARAVARGRRTS